MQKVHLSLPLVYEENPDADAAGITHLVFDLGRVLVPIDQQLTFCAFSRLGARGLEHMANDYLKLDVLRQYETGQIDNEGFFEALRAFLPPGVSDLQIRDAWCAMIGPFTPALIDLLRQLRTRYRLLMLSNTSDVHIRFIEEQLGRDFGDMVLLDLFDKSYLSHQIGLMKPAPEIYRYLIGKEGVEPGKLLFIDDRRENVEAARREGIVSVWLQRQEALFSLFC